MVVVIGDDRLHSRFSALGGGEFEVHKLPKSGGVVRRDDADRQALRARRWREYFYGGAADLRPISLDVFIDEVHVFRVDEAPQAPLTALPLGAIAGSQPLLAVTPLDGAQLGAIVHTILAVVRAKPDASADELVGAPVAGAVLVIAVDLEKKRITLLAPSPLPLPSPVLVAGSLKWSDHAS